MAIISFISAMVATAVHGTTCKKSDAEKVQEQQQQADAYYAPGSSVAYMSDPCTHGFLHNQCPHGYCGMCRFQTRRERRAERELERAIDRAERRGRGCHRRHNRRCRSAGPVMVVAAPVVPPQQVRSQRGYQQQQQQGVQSLESLDTREERPSLTREREPPAYETIMGEKSASRI